MEAIQQFRVRAIRLSSVLTGIVALILIFWNVRIALGLLLGAASGIAAFHLLTRRVEGFAQLNVTEIQLSAMRGMFQRLGLYALALTAAFYLDPHTKWPLFAGVGGILIPRVVLYVLAFTSLQPIKKSEAVDEQRPDA